MRPNHASSEPSGAPAARRRSRSGERSNSVPITSNTTASVTRASPRVASERVHCDANTRAFFDGADPAEKESLAGELSIEGGALRRRERDEETACRLWVVAEREQGFRHTFEVEAARDEIAVTGVATCPDTLAGEVKRAVDRGQAVTVEHDPDAAARCDPVRVAKQPEPRDVGDGMRIERAQRFRGFGVQRAHPRLPVGSSPT